MLLVEFVGDICCGLAISHRSIFSFCAQLELQIFYYFASDTFSGFLVVGFYECVCVFS